MRFLPDFSLAAFNTFGVAAQARRFALVANEHTLIEWCVANAGAEAPFLLGGGSNVLFTRDVEAPILQLALLGRRVVFDEGGTVLVEAMAGERWHAFVEWTLGLGLSGLENLALIPGCVGAAPVQNIGAYGVEMAERCAGVIAIDTTDGSVREFSPRECAFGYRDSIFKRGGAALPRDRYAITRVRFRLSRRFTPRLDYGDIRAELDARGVGTPTAQAVAEAVAAIRRRRLPDPAVQGNAGSFFKNPIVAADVAQALRERFGAMPQYPHGGDGREVKLSAAWLIEQVDWKGRGIHPDDAAAVSAQHALVLVNRGGATGGALWALAQAIQHDVAERFGVMLEPEPRIV